MRDDVPVVQARHHLGLLSEPVGEARAEAFWANDLQRNVALELLIARQ